MLAVPVTDDVLAEAQEDVDGNAKELALALIGIGTADIGSGSSPLRFAAAGGSLALGRTACEETSRFDLDGSGAKMNYTRTPTNVNCASLCLRRKTDRIWFSVNGYRAGSNVVSSRRTRKPDYEH
ncbi:hypothetical protein AVEN_157449-1 [Araneus ventricosus]|uniref:Uncharacterized protein n=1 Tax=Araneus ventricosus TaxID=182803 RepID=A0A4Y2PRT8_ARAVE|nr:hypothetical protein AVEN_157449-1 [Araneus ventricosus]